MFIGLLFFYPTTATFSRKITAKWTSTNTPGTVITATTTTTTTSSASYGYTRKESINANGKPRIEIEYLTPV